MLIKDEGLKRALLKAMADEEASKILSCTAWNAKSVTDLIRECNIPHTSAYRLVSDFKKNGLLVVERIVLSKDGKKYAMYRSVFRSVNVKFEGDRIELEATPNKDVMDKAFRLFYSLKQENGEG